MTDRSALEEANDSETTFQRLLQLSESKDAQVRRALVDNPSIAVNEDGEVTNQILLKLVAEFPDDVVRSPSFTLFGFEFKHDSMSEVTRRLAAYSKNGQVLCLLFTSFWHDENLRRIIATNHRTPEEVVIKLSNAKTEPSPWIRMLVAIRRDSLPEDAMRILGNAKTEPSPLVRESIASRRRCIPEDIYRVLGNPATEPNERVRLRVAKHFCAPPDVLRILGNINTEPSTDVRKSVADHSGTPEDVLRSLADENTEPDYYVRKTARDKMRMRDLL